MFGLYCNGAEFAWTGTEVQPLGRTSAITARKATRAVWIFLEPFALSNFSVPPLSADLFSLPPSFMRFSFIGFLAIYGFINCARRRDNGLTSSVCVGPHIFSAVGRWDSAEPPSPVVVFVFIVCIGIECFGIAAGVCV